MVRYDLVMWHPKFETFTGKKTGSLDLLLSYSHSLIFVPNLKRLQQRVHVKGNFPIVVFLYVGEQRLGQFCLSS